MVAHEDHTARRLQRKQEEWSRKDKEDLDNCVRALAQHGQGRAYLYWLLEISNALGSGEIFTGNALTTAFKCGEQNVGKQVLAHFIEVAPDDFLKVLKEKQDERNRRTAESTRVAATGSRSDTEPDTDSGANGG